MTRPVLGFRALNEYHRVSLLTYLGLRYTLASTAAGTDRWAEEAAAEILRREDGTSYLYSKQYKEVGDDGSLEYRDVFYPGANQALAESALLRACAVQGKAFAGSEAVFSYRLAAPHATDGVFVPYFRLFAARQTAIAKACRRNPQDLVIYADLRRFYPSVRHGLALGAWNKTSRVSRLGHPWQQLGEILLKRSPPGTKGLLIGPMFSHLIGNLVLADFDAEMQRKFAGRYFRYVDDIALVIPADAESSARGFLREQLRRFRLPALNPKKDCRLSAQQWLQLAPYQLSDYADMDQPVGDICWMRFVDDIKCLLVLHPELEGELGSAFRNEGVRFALPRFRSAVAESAYRNRFASRFAKAAFRRRLRGLSVREIVRRIRLAATLYLQDFHAAIERFLKAEEMERKWLVSRLRYALCRLVSVASDGELGAIAAALRGQSRFAEYHALFDALATRDVSQLVRFSGKVCAAGGQALATMGKPVRCAPAVWSREVIEGYVTMLLQGVQLYPEPPEWVSRRSAVRVVTGGLEARQWHEASSPFLCEFAALAGTPSLENHLSLLQAPLDPDERWVLFADELWGGNS